MDGEGVTGTEPGGEVDPTSVLQPDAVIGGHLAAYAPQLSLPGVPLEHLCLPEGTIAFPAKYPGLHDDLVAPYTMFEVVAGAHVYRIRRDPDRKIRAIHASAGGGTLLAAVDLLPLAPSEEVVIVLRWTPESLDFDISAGSTRLHADGQASAVRVVVDAQGMVYEIGPALQGVRVCAGGVMLVAPSAIELWDETVSAVATLLTGTSSSSDFGPVVANSAIAMLVSGYEAYGQRRFVELELEGVRPDAKRFLSRFGSKDEKRAIRTGNFNVPSEGLGRLAEMLADRLSFQNYDDCKNAYRLAYDLRFSSLGVSSHVPGRLKRLILYRHRIVHVSPALILLNQPEVPPQKPEEASVALANDALTVFDRYIRSFHSATLKLRSAPFAGPPNDTSV